MSEIDHRQHIQGHFFRVHHLILDSLLFTPGIGAADEHQQQRDAQQYMLRLHCTRQFLC